MPENWAKAESFFKCPVPREKMDVPDLGLIWIYGLTSGEKDDYENKVYHMDRGDRRIRIENARAILMQMTVRDQHGNRLFSDKDIGKLKTVPASIADPIMSVAKKLSGMDPDELEKLVKNSLTGRPEQESGSDSE